MTSSSSSSYDDLPKSSKNVWVLLSGSSLLKSKEFIGTELERNASHIIMGINYFKRKKNSSDAVKEFEKNKIEDIPLSFLDKMSVLLNVDAMQCYELFCSYLMFEYKGTPSNVKTLFSSDKHMKQLLHSLWHYYYEERLFGLLCLKQILSQWQHSSPHPYRQLFHSFLEAANDDSKILTNLIKQLESLSSRELIPSRATNGPYFTDELSKYWYSNNLKEKTEVLQLLLLYFKHLEFSTNNIINLMMIFHPKVGTSLQSHHSDMMIDLHDVNDDNLMKFINFLQSLVIVQCFGLKWLCECQEKDMGHKHHLLEDVSSLKELNSKIMNINKGLDYNSPILLGWMLVRSWELSDFDATNSSYVVRQLGKSALKLNVFNYFNRSLQLPHVIALKDTIVSDLIYGVIGDLLSVTFSIYSINDSGFSSLSLNQLSVTLFKNNNISNDVFVNGLDNGCGVIIRSSLNNFPFQTELVLDYCCALAETNACQKIFEELSILSNLTSYTESFEMSKLLIPTQNESIYTLLNDRMLYHDREMIIKKDTFGHIKEFNRQTLIEWRDVNINGWRLLYHRYRNTLNMISHGQVYAVGEESIKEMTQIATLCSHIVHHQCFSHIPAFNDVIYLCFESYDVLSQFQHPPRALMAAVLELAAAVMKQTPDFSERLWQRMNEKKFLPFMIGLTNDLQLLFVGKDTNPSTIGDIIASEECIRGYYELCSAFLKFICEAVDICKLRNDNNLLASVIYIINEIFPSHNGWNYNEVSDRTKIGRLCYEIFHRILIIMNKNDANHSKLEQICISSLMEGVAAEKLLSVVKKGESVVRHVITTSGSDVSLVNDDEIIIVRKSLSILSRLIVLHSNSKANTTVVENALFSSHNKPNMLLILSHYVFQRYDSRLATLAVLLLKRLAKKFPMSMLACLGSDAESIRDHFLFRLEEVTEDLRLKIALLDFLSVCVQHQAGLMEMFLNIVSDSSENGTTGCLQTVLEILEEKREGKYFCPFELHSAALKFLYTFWLQPHLLAIDSLKKTNNVWTLVTFPIFEDTINNKLCSYVLRILAREIFYVKTLERDKFDCDLERKFKSLKESDHILKLSSHVCSLVDSINDNHEDSFALLSAWKDFTVSLAKFDPFNCSKEMKTVIVEDLLNCFLDQIKKPNSHHPSLTLLIDMILILHGKWRETCISSIDEWNLRNMKIIDALNEGKENFPFTVMISAHLFLIEYLQIVNESAEPFNRSKLLQWTLPACGLVNHSLRVIEKQMKLSENSRLNEMKLSVVSVSLLTSLLKCISDQSPLWLSNLRNNSIIESLTNLLLFLITNKIGLELANAVLYLFITLSSIVPCAEVMLITEIIDNICVLLQITYDNECDKKVENVKFSWIHVFHLSLHLVNGMLNSMRHHFVDTTITFVAVHFDHIRSILTNVRTLPVPIEVHECTLIVSLLQSLSKYSDIWKKQHSVSYESICSEMSKTCNAITAFLIRPNLLAHIMEHPHHAAAALTSTPLTPKKISPKHEIEERTLRKSISWDSEIFTHSTINSEIHYDLLKIQMISLRYLINISPNIIELMEKQGIDQCDWDIICTKSFSTPNIDPEIELSFGSLISSMQLCIKTISTTEKVHSNDGIEASKQKLILILIHIFESSLSLIVSQSLIAQLSSNISTMDKEIIIRELNTEINSLLSTIGNRPSKRSGQSTFTSTPKSATFKIIEQRYVKLLLQLIEKMS